MNHLELFELKKNTPSDIGGHLETLRSMSEGAVVVEFGVRAGNSTAAWIAGKARALYSYDHRTPVELGLFSTAAKSAGVGFEFRQADTGTLGSIPECDILFIDTLHTGDHLSKELRHSSSARKFVVLHDTVTFAEVGEGGGLGLSGAIAAFLRLNPQWEILNHFTHCNGLMILQRKNR